MLLLEIIGQFIVEVLFFEFLGGVFIKINNSILKLRGIATKSTSEIKLDKIKKRYELKSVKLLRKRQGLMSGVKGVVLEVIDLKYCFVEFNTNGKEIKKIKITDLIIIRREELSNT